MRVGSSGAEILLSGAEFLLARKEILPSGTAILEAREEILEGGEEILEGMAAILEGGTEILEGILGYSWEWRVGFCVGGCAKTGRGWMAKIRACGGLNTKSRRTRRRSDGTKPQITQIAQMTMEMEPPMNADKRR